MPFIPAPAGVAKVRYTWGTGDPLGQNVFHVDTGTGAPLTPAQCDQLVTQAVEALTHDAGGGETVMGQLAESWFCMAVDVEDASAADGASVHSSQFVQGEVLTPSVPPGVAIVSTWYTGFRGRDKRGRTYWMGFPEGHVSNNGAIDTTQHDTFATAINSFRSAWASGGVEFPDMVGLVVASYFHPVGSPPVTTPRATAQITPITSGVVRLFAHSQRRRNLDG